MARLNLQFPEDQYCFSTQLTVRITDINAANHLANDSMISMISEARARFLFAYGVPETRQDGSGIIVTDLATTYKAEAHARDPARGEVVQVPAVGGLVGGRVELERGVLQPRLRVARGVLPVALEQPGLHPRRHPRTRARVPRCGVGVGGVPRRDLPVGEQLRGAALGEHVRQGRDQLRDDPVALAAAVAVGQHGRVRVRARGDHERRVRDHEVEPLPRHRRQQIAGRQPDPVLKPLPVEAEHVRVEQQVEPGEGQGALGQVGGDHAIDPAQQPVDRRRVELQAAAIRTQAQQFVPARVVELGQAHVHTLRQARTQIRQHQAERIRRLAGGVEHAASRVVGAVVEIEQRDLLGAIAGDTVEAIDCDHIGAMCGLGGVAQATGDTAQWQIRRGSSEMLRFRADADRQMGFPGARRARHVQRATHACQREITQLGGECGGIDDQGVESLVGRVAQCQRQLRR